MVHPNEDELEEKIAEYGSFTLPNNFELTMAQMCSDGFSFGGFAQIQGMSMSVPCHDMTNLFDEKQERREPWRQHSRIVREGWKQADGQAEQGWLDTERVKH